MSNNRIAILCNGLVPQPNIPVAAQTVRVMGLFFGLQDYGLDVAIVSPADSVSSAIKRWGYLSISIPEYWHIVPNESIADYVNNNFKFAIFCNWACGDGFIKNDSTILIYDFFSPTMVEHKYISNENIDLKLTKKLSLLAQADCFIANGDRITDYAKNFLANISYAHDSKQVLSVPLSMPWLGNKIQSPLQNRLFWGGYKQIWTNTLSIQEINDMLNYLEAKAYVLGGNINYNLPKFDLNPSITNLHNIITIRPCSLNTYCKINSSSTLSIDIFSVNEERKLSYSTRSIVSIACGCPVLHMSECSIGEKIVNTKTGGWVLDKLDFEKCKLILSDILCDHKQLRSVQESTYDFWQENIDPIRQTQPLAQHILSLC